MSSNKFNRPNLDNIEAAFDSARGSRMSTHEIEWMLVGVIRIPAAHAVALSRLEVSMFTDREQAYVLLWKSAVKALASCNGALPESAPAALEILRIHCAAELATDPSRTYYTPAVQHQVLGTGELIDDTIAFPIDDDLANKAIDLLGQFLRERTLSDVIKRAMAGIGPNDTIKDASLIITAIENKARELVGMDTDPGSMAIIDNFVPYGRRAVTTKVSFLDKLMGGGHADCECYAVLGPSSGGKSALACQIVMESAELEAATASELGEDQSRYWYYFTWELTESQLRTRMYSYGARTQLTSFNDFVKYGTPYSTSAKPETLKPYESDPYVNSPGNPILGEKERLAALQKRMSGIGANLKIVDYSSDRAGHGDNSVDGIAAYLRSEVSKGIRIGGVVVDYAKLVVDRYIAAKQLRPEAQYQLLSSFGNMMRSKVAIPFKCKAWVLHQLHGSAAKKRFGKLHYSDALGCKNFADNFDFGIEFGMYNETNGLVEFSSSKHRHAAGLADGIVAKFNGLLGVFREPDQEYVRDPATGQLVPRDFVNRVTPSTQPGYRTAAAQPTFNPLDGID